jgi:hypothetical protein
LPIANAAAAATASSRTPTIALRSST